MMSVKTIHEGNKSLVVEEPHNPPASKSKKVRISKPRQDGTTTMEVDCTSDELEDSSCAANHTQRVAAAGNRATHP
jgi:hypothetical protein